MRKWAWISKFSSDAAMLVLTLSKKKKKSISGVEIVNSRKQCHLCPSHCNNIWIIKYSNKCSTMAHLCFMRHSDIFKNIQAWNSKTHDRSKYCDYCCT